MRILNAVRPTMYQKRVIAVIASAPTPKLASEQVSGDQNLTAARDMLVRLGAVTVGDGNTVLTDLGQRIAQEENIVDDAGELTQMGQELAGTSEPADAEPTPQEPLPGAQLPSAPAGSLEEPSLESFSLLKELIKS